MFLQTLPADFRGLGLYMVDTSAPGALDRQVQGGTLCQQLVAVAATDLRRFLPLHG
jgi:hypothetical protein